MLNKWTEIEGDGATKDEIIYILEGLKMKEAFEGVFAWESTVRIWIIDEDQAFFSQNKTQKRIMYIATILQKKNRSVYVHYGN